MEEAVIRRVQLRLAKPSENIVDYIEDISLAVEHVKYNLATRHHVDVSNLRVGFGNTLLLDLFIPEAISCSFSIGRHLRGISKYLLSEFYDRYAQLLVGTRLLEYTNVENDIKMDRKESIMYEGITGTGAYGIVTTCKYRLPCGYCELKKGICTAENPITITPTWTTPTWTMPMTTPTDITCSAERKEE